MKKDTIRTLASIAILLAIYILVVFLVPFERGDIFWLSFGVTVAAFVVAGSVTYANVAGNTDSRSRFYHYPVVRIALIYGATQLVLSLIFMALGWWIPLWAAILVYAVILGAALICLISAGAVVDHIQEQDRQLKKDTTRMRVLQSKANQLLSMSDAPELKKFAEELRYSDPVSSPALQEVERDLAAAVDEIQSAVVDGDAESVTTLCRKATAILLERNRLCKLHKH